MLVTKSCLSRSSELQTALMLGFAARLQITAQQPLATAIEREPRIKGSGCSAGKVKADNENCSPGSLGSYVLGAGSPVLADEANQSRQGRRSNVCKWDRIRILQLIMTAALRLKEHPD